jgi:hypothetical protein
LVGSTDFRIEEIDLVVLDVDRELLNMFVEGLVVEIDLSLQLFLHLALDLELLDEFCLKV